MKVRKLGLTARPGSFIVVCVQQAIPTTIEQVVKCKIDGGVVIFIKRHRKGSNLRHKIKK